MSIDLLRPDATLVLPCGRDRLLRYLPKGGRVAEIGVFKGKFSAKILSRTKPSRLTLVDAWDTGVERGHIPRLKRLEAARFDKLATSLPRRLKWRSPATRIESCRSLSVPAADRYPDGELDWIYIDADHSYEGALADLRAWAPKLREDGLILGHDFTDQTDSFGVIRAVADFVGATEYRFLCLTTDYFPTFVLSRSLTGTTERFLRALFGAERFLYQLDSKAVLSVHHSRYKRGDSKTGVLSDFLPPA